MLATKIARHKIDLNFLIEEGSPEQKGLFIRSFIASIEVDGKDRKIRIG